MTRAVTAQRQKPVDAPMTEPRHERIEARRQARPEAHGTPLDRSREEQGQTEEDARLLGEYNLHNG